MRNENSQHYFNNLDGLRFFAAVLVIVHHLEQFKYLAGLPSYWDTSFIAAIGPQAVNFFFVLSGFLITYLLLREVESSGRVGIKAFYLRRILRIWPLYYLTVLLGFFVLPNTVGLAFQLLPRMQPENFGTLLTLFLFFLPNIALLKYPPVLGVSQGWSLGVEEQFYIIWPVLIHWFRKTPLALLVGVIVLKLAFLKVCDHYCNVSGVSMISGYLNSFSLEAMAAGGFAACWLLSDKSNSAARNEIILYAIAGLSATFLLGYGTIGLTVAAYSAIIMCAAKAPPIGGPFYAPLQSAGKLSYGLYMLHTSAIMICLNVLMSLHVDLKSAPASVYLYAGTFALTLVLAYCSYRFLELPIMRLKNRITPRAESETKTELEPETESNSVRTCVR